ncbi:MAG: SGNH/GDSL hydrolase family protein [Nitrospira sp.]|nr:SGNH/GDSL hydrolase family protein [Nitrospira sp.]
MAAELCMRAYLADITTTHDNRSYFAFKWKAAHVSLNQRLYREREINGHKDNRVYRVAIIGDSFTFGQGIDEEDRLSNLLERSFPPLPFSRRIEVLNFGKPGANTTEEVTILQKDVLPRRPDFVLLQWYVNDVENNGPSQGSPNVRTFTNQVKQFLLNHSVLYFLVVDSVHRLRSRFGRSYAADLFGRVGNPHSLEAQEAEKALREFFNKCRDYGVPMGVILVPDLSPIRTGHYPFLYLHQRVLSICAEANVTCLDLLPVFMPYLTDSSKVGDLWVNRFDAHMSPFANRLAAEKVLEVWGPIWRTAYEVKSVSGEDVGAEPIAQAARE